MRVPRASIGFVFAVAGGIACSSSSATGLAEGGLDGNEPLDASSEGYEAADADGGTECIPRGCPDASVLDGQASCNQVSDCPPNPGASCANVCSDGSNPCVIACVTHQCVERGCPDAGVIRVGTDAGDSGEAGDAAAAGCGGAAPNCFGNDTQMCCGQDPSGPASCVSGAWRCGTSPAPGCNGTSCLARDGSAG